MPHHYSMLLYLANIVVVTICLWKMFGLITGAEHDPHILHVTKIHSVYQRYIFIYYGVGNIAIPDCCAIQHNFPYHEVGG
jgi:hypothetical protein